jgi:hypothetical protein
MLSESSKERYAPERTPIVGATINIQTSFKRKPNGKKISKEGC